MNNIYLIGMMGSGKSVVGEKVAAKLSMEHIDIDSEVEYANQMDIQNIFETMGEGKFREMESAFFIEKAKQPNQIFSTGGGIILNDDCCDILKNKGTTFFLKADCKVLLNRINEISKRPLLDVKNPIESLSLIWEQRKEFYYKSCHHIIETDRLSIDEVVDELLKKVNI